LLPPLGQQRGEMHFSWFMDEGEDASQQLELKVRPKEALEASLNVSEGLKVPSKVPTAFTLTMQCTPEGENVGKAEVSIDVKVANQSLEIK